MVQWTSFSTAAGFRPASDPLSTGSSAKGVLSTIADCRFTPDYAEATPELCRNYAGTMPEDAGPDLFLEDWNAGWASEGGGVTGLRGRRSVAASTAPSPTPHPEEPRLIRAHAAPQPHAEWVTLEPGSKLDFSMQTRLSVDDRSVNQARIEAREAEIDADRRLPGAGAQDLREAQGVDGALEKFFITPFRKSVSERLNLTAKSCFSSRLR
jgi:hypothetical protein